LQKKNNLFVTIGSDFHYIDGIHPVVGLFGEKINLSNKEIDNIIKNLLK